MRRVSAVVLSFLLLGISYPLFAAKEPGNIGWVDMQRALESVDAGKLAKKSFEAEMAKTRDALKKEEETLKGLQEEYQKKEMALSEKAKREKATELQKRMMEFQQKFQEAQAQMQRREKELTLPILQELVKVVEDISKEEQLEYVLERSQSSLVYAKADRDITERVITKYNKLYDKSGKKK